MNICTLIHYLLFMIHYYKQVKIKKRPNNIDVNTYTLLKSSKEFLKKNIHIKCKGSFLFPILMYDAMNIIESYPWYNYLLSNLGHMYTIRPCVYMYLVYS